MVACQTAASTFQETAAGRGVVTEGRETPPGREECGGHQTAVVRQGVARQAAHQEDEGIGPEDTGRI